MLQLHSTQRTIQTLCDRIRTKTNGKYLRFGDGDFLIMKGNNEQLANATPEFSRNLMESFRAYEPNDMLAVNFHTPDLGLLEPGMGPGVHLTSGDVVHQNIVESLQLVPSLRELYSATALHHVMVTNPRSFVTVLHTIQEHGNVILVGDETFSPNALQMYFGPHRKVNGPSFDSYEAKGTILAEFEAHLQSAPKGEHLLIVLALGCGGRALVPEMEALLTKYALPAFFLDFGSPIDVLMGSVTRHWISEHETTINIRYIQMLNQRTLVPNEDDPYSIQLRL